MTTISDELARDVRDYCDSYALDSEDLSNFTKVEDYRTKQDLALRMIRRSIDATAKVSAWEPLFDLAKLERTITNLEGGPRDHVVHAMNLFILGIYINHELFEKHLSVKVDPFQWKLAGLFHDSAYPAEIGYKLACMYARYSDTDFVFSSRNLGRLHKKKWFWFRANGFDLIQKRLVQWNLDIDVNRAYEESPSSHSIVGALGLLKLIDGLYQSNNPKRAKREVLRASVDWNEKYFEEDVVSACSAIFIHNLDAGWFKNVKIDLKSAPLPFLLKLCDSLQDWGRHSEAHPDGIPAREYGIDIADGRINYRAPADREERINKELSATLEGIQDLVMIDPQSRPGQERAS